MPLVKSPNALLDALPEALRRELLSRAQPVAFAPGEVLFEPHSPLKHVWFVTSGVASLVLMMKDGTAAEVATVGNEGLLGMPVFYGTGRSPAKALGQVRGDAIRVRAEHFRATALEHRPLRDIVLRYSHALVALLAQSTACNQLHTLQQRMCRWLLMTHDRVGADEFHLTQDLLAQMLGVHRPSVTVAALALQKAGLIRYQRGDLRILDRRGLEANACECYEAVRREFVRLLPAG